MMKSQERIIDGATFAVTQFPPFKALAILARLKKALGGSVAALLAGGMKGSLKEISMDSLVIAVEKLADGMKPDEFAEFCRDLTVCTLKDGKDLSREGMFEAAFGGNLLTLFKVLAFILEVNFADFFGQGGIGGLMKRFAPANPPTETATGSTSKTG